MPRGDKSKYTKKQDRQAEHIEEGYEKRGVSKTEAERRAWATVNKSSGGGKKSGSGRGKATNKSPSKNGGKKGGASSGQTIQRREIGSGEKGRGDAKNPRKVNAFQSETAFNSVAASGYAFLLILN